MLKPEDIKHIQPAVDASRDAEVEAQFDQAILRAAESDEWPAVVERCRDGITNDVVERVAKRFRDVGWLVLTRFATHRAIIYKPDGAQ